MDQYIKPKKEGGAQQEMRLYNEFTEHLDPRLRAVMLDTARRFYLNNDKILWYTCVNRSEPENKRAGGAQYSAHLYGRALDLRVHHLTETEVNMIVSYINDHWLRDELWLFILVHGKGANRHLHINIKYSHTHGSFA